MNSICQNRQVGVLKHVGS